VGINVNSGGRLIYAQPIDSTLSSIISGGGVFEKAGPSTLTLAANNSGYSGILKVVGGRVKVGNAGGLGMTNGTITVEAGGQVDLNGLTREATRSPTTLRVRAQTDRVRSSRVAELPWPLSPPSRTLT